MAEFIDDTFPNETEEGVSDINENKNKITMRKKRRVKQQILIVLQLMKVKE